MIEKEFDYQLFATVKGLAPTLGWQSYHTLRSKGSASGYPDRTLWRERVVFAELKTDARDSKPTDRQIHVLTALAVAGAEVYLWRPGDIEEIGRILGTRGVFDRTTSSLATWGERWHPGTLWLPDGHRADQSIELPLAARSGAA